MIAIIMIQDIGIVTANAELKLLEFQIVEEENNSLIVSFSECPSLFGTVLGFSVVVFVDMQIFESKFILEIMFGCRLDSWRCNKFMCSL